MNSKYFRLSLEFYNLEISDEIISDISRIECDGVSILDGNEFQIAQLIKKLQESISHTDIVKYLEQLATKSTNMDNFFHNSILFDQPRKLYESIKKYRQDILEMTTSIFECRYCKSTKTSYSFLSTRAADEIQSVKIECKSCNSTYVIG